MTHIEDVMKNKVLLLLLISMAAPLWAEELTVDGLIAAHNAGLSSDTIIKLVNDPENRVAPFTPADLERLTAAGVPAPVIEAFSKKGNPGVKQAAVPDNKDLYALVKLVDSGLSEKLIVDQIGQSGLSQKPTMTDLIFLKENQVPEIVIGALMNAKVGDEADAAPFAKVAKPAGVMNAPVGKVPAVDGEDESGKQVFDGLVHHKTFRGRPGKLVLEDDKLLWRDANKGKHSFDMYLNGIKNMTLIGTPKDADMFYFRVVIEFTRGQSYTFEDINKEVGGNENLTAFIEYMKANHEDIVFVEKSK